MQGNMAPQEFNNPAIAIPEYSDIPEAQTKDLKMIQVLKKEMSKS